MRRHRIFQRMPSGQSLRESRFLKPFAPYLDRHFLWQINRKAVAGGIAVGLFFGILSPVAQIFFAAIGAIFLRVNLPVAAFGTFVTNPFTAPPIYYGAYRLGDFLTGGGIRNESALDQGFFSQLSEALSSFPLFLDWCLGIGLPLLLGLAVVASASAALGYVAVHGLWSMSVRRRWSKRRARGCQFQ